jgi:hypothetical protein
MSHKPWHLDRRSFLRGVGVSCTLPYLEAMELDAQALAKAAGSAAAPKRACFVYWPNGCSLPKESDTANAHWRWFPSGAGKDFQFTKVLESLEPFKDQTAIYGGLSHPRSRELLGHLAGDTWLTGGDLRGGEYKNNISVDQVAARHLKKYTRYPSFTFSTDGGVGYKSRVSTLSFDESGNPMASEHQHRLIFERYFAVGGDGATDERRRSIREGKRIVDLVLEESKRLQKRLGKRDQRKLDEYLESLGSVEEQVKRNEEWLDTPLKPFSSDHLALDPNPKVDPAAYVRTMYDLMVLGFQTDVTRVMSYMLAREDGMGFGDGWPRVAVGVNKGHHTISHDSVWEQWGPYDRWYAEQFAYFMKRMSETSDEWGPLINNTMTLYGSACTTTHNARNYPMAIVGGKDLGLRLGHYTRFSKTAMLSSGANQLTGAVLEKPKESIGEDDWVCCDLYVSMLQALGIETEEFSDSTGPLDGFFA